MGAVNPFRTWRTLGGGAKLAAYTRLSVQAIEVVFGAYLVVVTFVIREGGEPSPWVTALGVGCTVLLTACCVAVTEFRPEFNTVPRRGTGHLLTVTGALGALFWIVGVLLALLADGATADAGILLVFAVLVLVPLGVLPWLPYHWVVAVVLGAASAVVARDELHWWPVVYALVCLATTVLSAWTVQVAKQLDRARITESALQVSEERLRFAQELHDTVGQRLAAMSVKAELARALAARGDDRLDAELAELQSLTRTTVGEMHDVVEGYRTADLTTELRSARDLLTSAGVECSVDGGPGAVGEPLDEVAAWLVREAATNVVRHSEATWVRITLTPDTVAVANDGAVRDIDRLSGLAGIRRRAEPAGASLVAERDGNLFTVTLTGAS
jgi:two-component system sensor histidine kinase DesK